jgi:hypothetical protein
METNLRLDLQAVSVCRASSSALELRGVHFADAGEIANQISRKRTRVHFRSWPATSICEDRFAILPKVASARNADVKSHLDRFRVYCRRDQKFSLPVEKLNNRP